MTLGTLTNSPAITALATALKLAHSMDATLHRAVDRALENLPGASYEFDGTELRVVSMSRRKSGMWHVTDGESCTCEGAKHTYCWHRIAFRLLLSEAVLRYPQFIRSKVAEQMAPADVVYTAPCENLDIDVDEDRADAGYRAGAYARAMAAVDGIWE